MEKVMAKKQKKWVKLRHKIITKLAYFVLYPIVKLKYGVKINKFKEQGKRAYFIMMNHQTEFDQFFIGCAFKGPIYYVASEDLFSKGFISKLLKYAVAPIPIKKQSTDVRAVMNCIKVAKEGGTIAIAPEGNRTYSGKTEYIRPAIAPLAKKLKLPIAFFKIENGYGVHPRWSDNTRKGKMQAGVSKVLEPEEYLNMTDEQLYELIKRELYVNEARVSGEFYHKNSAEYLERLFYVCPRCGLTNFKSKGKFIKCNNCGLEAEYTSTKQFKGVNGSSFPFEFVNDWYTYQQNFVNNLDLNLFTEKFVYEDIATLFKVIVYKNKKTIKKNAHVKLYGNRIEIECDKRLVFDFEKVHTITVLGRNKLNIYIDDDVFQLKGDKSFNAMKYMNFFFRYNNMKKGGNDGKLLFLGF